MHFLDPKAAVMYAAVFMLSRGFTHATSIQFKTLFVHFVWPRQLHW